MISPGRKGLSVLEDVVITTLSDEDVYALHISKDSRLFLCQHDMKTTDIMTIPLIFSDHHQLYTGCGVSLPILIFEPDSPVKIAPQMDRETYLAARNKG